jgi:hypothetical protein
VDVNFGNQRQYFVFTPNTAGIPSDVSTRFQKLFEQLLKPLAIAQTRTERCRRLNEKPLCLKSVRSFQAKFERFRRIRCHGTNGLPQTNRKLKPFRGFSTPLLQNRGARTTPRFRSNF